jgi:hypothetical protein
MRIIIMRLLLLVGVIEIIVDVLGLAVLLLADPFLKQGLEVLFFNLTFWADVIALVFVVFFLGTVVKPAVGTTLTEAHTHSMIVGTVVSGFLAFIGFVLQANNFGLGASTVGWITAGIWVLILIGDSTAVKVGRGL